MKDNTTFSFTSKNQDKLEELADNFMKKLQTITEDIYPEEWQQQIELKLKIQFISIMERRFENNMDFINKYSSFTKNSALDFLGPVLSTEQWKSFKNHIWFGKLKLL